MKTISPRALFSQFRNGTHPIVLDMRSSAEHAKTRIPGSQSLPLSRVPVTDFNRITHHAFQEVYLVCQSGRLSSLAYDNLDGAGIGQAVVVEGGLIAWEQAGLPLERATVNTFSLERQVRIVAGSLILLGLVLGWLVHPAFVGLAGLAGGGLTFAGFGRKRGKAGLPAQPSWNAASDDLASSRPAESST